MLRMTGYHKSPECPIKTNSIILIGRSNKTHVNERNEWYFQVNTGKQTKFLVRYIPIVLQLNNNK